MVWGKRLSYLYVRRGNAATGGFHGIGNFLRNYGGRKREGSIHFVLD